MEGLRVKVSVSGRHERRMEEEYTESRTHRLAGLEDLLVEVVVVELDGRRSERKRREEQARRHIIFACACVSCRSPRNTRHAYMHVYNALQVL